MVAFQLPHDVHYVHPVNQWAISNHTAKKGFSNTQVLLATNIYRLLAVCWFSIMNLSRMSGEQQLELPSQIRHLALLITITCFLLIILILAEWQWKKKVVPILFNFVQIHWNMSDWAIIWHLKYFLLIATLLYFI